MRLVPGTDTVPNAVNKYLLPHEHQVITVRKHPAVLLRPISITLLGLVIAALISTTVAVLGAIESLLSAVVADGMIDDRHDSNQELMGQGVANFVAGIFG